MSLAYLLRQLDRVRFDPLVAVNEQELKARQFFEAEGFAPLRCTAARFCHTFLAAWPLTRPKGIVDQLDWILRKYRASCRAIAAVVEEARPDLVHLNSLTFAPYAPTIKKLGIPVVMHVREPVVPGLIGVRRAWLRRLANKQVDRIIYICEDNRERLTGDAPHGRVIYNPVDFTVFDRSISQAAARSSLNLPQDRQIILCPGGSKLSVKGIFVMLAAMPLIRKRCPNAICVIPGLIGRDSIQPSVLRRLTGRLGEEHTASQLIDAHRIDDVVLRVPFSSQMNLFFAAADVVAIPFIVPHFSRAVMEAGAMAKPVVASRVGGVEEIVQEHGTGLFAKPGDAESLATAIHHILEDPNLAKRLGEGGHQQAIHRFDARINAQATMKVYEEVFGHHA